MKIKKLKFSLLFLILSLGLMASRCSELSFINLDSESELQTVNDSSGISPLSDEEIAGILFLREEEKLARDVYLYLYELFPLRPFENISKSEQAHMDAVEYLIETFQLTDPVADNPPGVFQNEDLQQLYNELIESGSKSEVDALKAGALIEEVDIIDLQQELDEVVVNEELARVYSNLLAASGNHLRAFNRVLGSFGVDYAPVKLSQEEFDAIIEN